MVKISGCPLEKLNEVADLTTKVFNDPFLMNVIYIEEEFKPENIRVLFTDTGEIVSVVCVSPRKMYLNNHIVTLGGIGGVATHPDHRRKGYAEMVMKDSIEFMYQDGYDLSILYPFKSEYYAKFGYRDFTTPFGVIKSDKASDKKHGYEIREFNEEKDLDDVMAIYDIFNRDKNGPVVRSRTYWRQKINKNKPLTDSFFVAETSNKVVGYVIVNYIKKTWTTPERELKVSEVGSLPGEEKSISVLINSVASIAPKKGFDRVFFDDIGLNIENSDVPDQTDVEKYTNLKQVKMFKVINIKSLLREITPELNRRIRKIKENAFWQEFVSIKHIVVDYQGAVEIVFRKSQNISKMDEGEFVKLLFGLQDLDELIIEGKEKLNPVEKNVLRTLFPKSKPIFWDFDYL